MKERREGKTQHTLEKKNLLRSHCNYKHSCSKIRVSKFIKVTLLQLKLHIDPHTVFVEDVNIPPLPKERSSRQKLNREIHMLNDVINQMLLTDIYRTLNPNRNEYTFYSVPDGTFRLTK